MDAITVTPQATASSRFDQTRHIGRRPITLGSLGQVLRWRWKLIAGIMTITLGAGIAACVIIPPRYLGEAEVRVMPSTPFASTTNDDETPTIDQALVNTEAAALQSRDLARKVVEANGLDHDPEFLPAKLDPMPGADMRTLLREAAVSKVLTRLAVTQQDKSYMLTIDFQSHDPAKAARIANAFAETYIDNTADIEMSTAGRQAAAGQVALQHLSDQAEGAAARVAQYRATTGIAQGGVNGTIADQQIAPLATQLATAQAQAASARSNVTAAEREASSGDASAVSAVLSSPVILELQRQRTEAEGTRAQLSARYGPKFPDLIQATQQIASFDTQIRAEQLRIIEGLKNAASAADAQVESLRGQLEQLKGQIAGNNQSAVRADSLQRSADSAVSAYNHLSASVQQSAAAQHSDEAQAQMVERAVVSTKPSFPNYPAVLAASLLAGAIFGLAGALASEGMQATLRHPDDIESLLGLPFVASVPAIGRRELAKLGCAGGTPADTLLTRPVSPFSEAFRSIRQTLRGHREPQGVVVAVSSTLPSEGKTTSSLALARVMAMGGDRVLLIDGDLRRAGLTAAVQQVPQHDLVDVLSARVSAAEAILPDAVARLDLLMVREPTFSAADLFSGPLLKGELSRLRAQYDFIIIDTPPLLGMADARSLARLADGLLLMVRWGKTPIAAVDAALAALEQDASPVVGAVLTMVDPNADAMGGQYYSAHYARYYAA